MRLVPRQISPLPLLLVLTVSSACIPRAGNQPVLTPAIRSLTAREGRFAITLDTTTHVAVFAVMNENVGWSLRVLSPQSQAIARGPQRTLTFALPRIAAPSERAIPVTRYGTGSSCGRMVSWIERAINSSIVPYTYSAIGVPHPDCTVSTTMPMPAWSTSGAWSSPFVLVVTSTASRTPDEWAAVAESVGIVGMLQRMPARVGRRAFAGDSSVRWLAEVRTIR